MKKIIGLSLLLFMSMNCFGQSSLSSLMIFGEYNPPNAHEALPIVATSNQDALKWTVSTITGLKNDGTDFVNYPQRFGPAISCTKNVCATIGVNDYPMVSQDHGLSWFQSRATDVWSPYNVTCYSDNNCLIASTSGLFKTSDSGNTWQKKSNAYAMLVDCSKDYCLAQTIDRNHHTSYMYSNDEGETWSNSKLSLLSKNYYFSAYTSSCFGKTCVAVGGYKPDAESGSFESLLLVSNDAGASWIQKDISQFIKNRDELTHIKCTQSYCVAISDKSIITSHDNGQTWGPGKILNSRLSSEYYNFIGLDCSAESCTILGSEFNQTDNSHLPFSLISTDKGDDWTYEQNVSGMSDYSLNLWGFAPGIFQCKDNTCIFAAAVSRKNDDKNEPIPAVLSSSDRGKHWTLINYFNGMPVGKGQWFNVASN